MTEPSLRQVEVRPARPEDLAAVARLGAKLVRQHHAMDPARFMLFEPIEPGYERYLAGEARNESAVVLAAVERGDAGEPDRVVGYAYGRLEPRNWNDLLEACGKLHDIYVDESARSRGVGAQLLEAMLSRLEALGAPRVVLLTAWQNESAQRLFKAAGFRPTMIEMTRENGA